MHKCGRSGKVLFDPDAAPAERYVCARCGKRFSTQSQATGHMAVCPAIVVEKLAKEKVIKTWHGTYIVRRQGSSPGINLSGIDEIDDEKE